MMGRKRLKDLGCDGDDNTEVLIHNYNDNNDDDGNDNEEEEELNEEELDDDYDDEREGILLKKSKPSLSGFSFIEMLGMGRRSQDRMPSLQEEDTLFSKPAPLPPPHLLHLSTPLPVHIMPALLPSVSEQELLYSSAKAAYEENGGVKEEEISQLVQQNDGGRATTVRKRRKRSSSASRVGKNVEEMENQRMVHITVERNRRKQMNEHLAVLQSLMPSSYIQRGDQASIIGGAIEFVKELEQILQSLRQRKQEVEELSKNPSHHHHHHHNVINLEGIDEHEIGKVEVQMLGPSSLLLKVVSHRITGCKLLQVISVLQHSLRLIIRHLDVTTIDHIVLYSFNIQMGDEIDSHSVHQLAFSVQQIFSKSTLNSTFEPLPN